MKSHRKYDMAIALLLCLMVATSCDVSTKIADKCGINQHLFHPVVAHITAGMTTELLID